MQVSDRDLDMIEEIEKRSTFGMTLEDLLDLNSTRGGPPQKFEIFADPLTVSLAGRTIDKAANQELEIIVKMDNAVINTERSCLMGEVWCSADGVIADARNLFSLIQLQQGSGISDSLAYNQFLKQIRRNLRGVDVRSDQLALKKNSFRDLHLGPLDGVNATDPSIFSGTFAATSWPSTVTEVSTQGVQSEVISNPYEDYYRDIVGNYFESSNGEFIQLDSKNYALCTFAIPLCELSDTLAAQEHVFTGLGEELRMVLRTNDYQECVTKVGATLTQPTYGLENLELLVCYTELDEYQVDRIAQNSIEFQIPRLIPFNESSVQPIYNANHSLSVSDKVKYLYIACFSNMEIGSANGDAIGDASNQPANLLGGANCRMSLQSAELEWSPLPSIQQISIQYGSKEIVINQQQLYVSHIVDLAESEKMPSRIQQAIQNALCIDLSRYGLDMIGSSSGASSSLLLTVTFALGNNSATGSQYRTMPFQHGDWTAESLARLEIFSFLECGTMVQLQRGVYTYV